LGAFAAAGLVVTGLAGRSGSLAAGRADGAVRSTILSHPLSAIAGVGDGVVTILVEGTALGSSGTGSILLVGVEFTAGGTGGGGGKEGKDRLTSPARIALTVSVILLGAMNRVAIANVAQLRGRINPLKAEPTTAKTVLSNLKLSNPSTTHLCCNMTLF